jgi:serine/threonine protein kinase
VTDTADAPTVLAGRYELLARLGSGGMADVYRARDTLLGRDVAVKVFRDASPEERFDERQQSEISLLARLNHPGLVTIFDAGSGVVHDGWSRAFLVMELVTGPSLADRLDRGGPLSPAHTAIIGAHVTEALAYIHQAGVVHRDVKPANILLPGGDRTGPFEAWTKLTDFGIARLVEDAHLTSTGLLIGTPHYLSPEQAAGASPGPPTDVYALGLVILECLTGVRAYPGSALESAAARLYRDPEIPDSLGSAWIDLLAAMTRRDAADRPTAAEASVAFRTVITVTQPTQAMPAPVPPPQVLPELVPPTQVLPELVPPTQVLPTRALPDLAAPAAGLPTQVLPTSPSPAHVSPHPVDTSATQILGLATDSADAADVAGPAPSLLRRVRAKAGSGRRPWLAAAAVLVIGAAVGFGLWLGTPDAGTSPGTTPTYPSVPGQLGVHLQQLQSSVKP